MQKAVVTVIDDTFFEASNPSRAVASQFSVMSNSSFVKMPHSPNSLKATKFAKLAGPHALEFSSFPDERLSKCPLLIDKRLPLR